MRQDRITMRWPRLCLTTGVDEIHQTGNRCIFLLWLETYFLMCRMNLGVRGRRRLTDDREQTLSLPSNFGENVIHAQLR
jgi:hypothetical protein